MLCVETAASPGRTVLSVGLGINNCVVLSRFLSLFFVQMEPCFSLILLRMQRHSFGRLIRSGTKPMVPFLAKQPVMVHT